MSYSVDLREKALEYRATHTQAETSEVFGISVSAIVPKPDRGETQSKGYTKSNFKHDKENDMYICPLGQQVTLPAKRTSKSKDKRYYCKACVGCPSKDLCTPKSKYGQRLLRILCTHKCGKYFANAVTNYT